jgi:hypothetical protein
MQWKVAQAKQRLSEVLRHAAQEPQEILNREELVAVVLGKKDLNAFREWQREHASPSLAEALKVAQRICKEEGYELPPSPRVDRENALLADAVLWVNDGGVGRSKQGMGRNARRHKRRQ